MHEALDILDVARIDRRRTHPHDEFAPLRDRTRDRREREHFARIAESFEAESMHAGR